MGPRPDGRGRTLTWLRAAWPYSLQWGRGRMAAEGGEALAEYERAISLQWGRGRMAAEGKHL